MGRRNLPDILTDKEQAKLLRVFNRRYRSGQRNRTMVLMGLRTGMRISELTALTWEDIEPETGRVHLKHAKGDVDRVLWIAPEVLTELYKVAKMFGRGPTGRVFTTAEGGELDTGYLRRTISKYARKAGITKRVHFHLLRHGYLTELYRRTKDIRIVQIVAGHASITTSVLYTHLSGEDVRAAMMDGADRA